MHNLSGLLEVPTLAVNIPLETIAERYNRASGNGGGAEAARLNA
jgi:hypothetical protein